MDMTEKTKVENTMFEGRILTVRRDIVELPDGKESFREIVLHNGGVCVAPLTDDGRLIFVRQYRYVYGEEILELPAGKLEKNEDPFEAGKRELEEETGMVAGRYYDMGKLYPSPGYCGEIIHLYAATELKYTKAHLDDGEFLEVEYIPFDKALEMVMTGGIRDSKTQVLILKIAEMMRRGEIK